MTECNLEAERAEQQHGRDRADAKIEAQRKRMADGSRTVQQKADDQQLMNEMRGNKAALDLNRAMRDYDDEHRDPPKPGEK